nr:hypothetical protein Itr_chr07CG12020 [Ipomoea trifida]
MGARCPSREQGARLGVRPGAGIGHLVGEQGHHDGKVGLLEALSQGCVNLLLDSSAARREGPLPVNPGQFVPDLRVDEGGEELLGYGLVGADEPSKAAGVLHLVDDLLLGLLRLVSSGLRLAELPLGLLGSILGGCKLLLQLPNSTLEPVKTMVNTYPKDILGDLLAEPVARPPHDGLHTGNLVPDLVDEGGG